MFMGDLGTAHDKELQGNKAMYTEERIIAMMGGCVRVCIRWCVRR